MANETGTIETGTFNPGHPAGFVPPPYPYDRIDRFKPLADRFEGGLIDLSIGTPVDPPPPAVVAALASADSVRGYPPSLGTANLRGAAQRWLERRFGVHVELNQIAAAVGTKEFVATLPQWLRLRSPDRDTVLYPAISYPTYAMGATLAGCRAVPVPSRADGTMDLDSISDDDAARSLVLWINSPSNPVGSLDDLGGAAAWGRAHGVPVFSDECYVEFIWDDPALDGTVATAADGVANPARTILEHGTEGVVAVHSLSKRSNLAGARVGFYAGDADLIEYLGEVRKHVGMMVPGPVQRSGAIALDDDEHVEVQRARYWNRLVTMADIVQRWAGITVPLPRGGFYLWVPVDDAWAFTEQLARDAGTLVSPGEFYGPDGADYVRIAVVQPDERIQMIGERLGQ